MIEAATDPLLELGEAVLAEAREWIGTRVVWEASLKGVACDCRGLVGGVARQLGRPEGNQIEALIGGYAGHIRENELLAGLNRLFDRVPDPAARRAGDVLAFRINRKVQHLAICAGENGRMVHAYMGDPARVCEVPIGRFWGNRLAGVWRWRLIDGGEPCQPRN